MVKSAERVLDILELLRQSGPSKFKEIADGLGLPKSSTSMLLGGLVRKGYLVLDPVTHLYRPTYRVALLGEGIERQAILGEGALLETLSRLHRECGETLVVGLRNGAYVQYIHVLSKSTSLMRRLPVGKLRPLAYNPLGKVLLARLDEAEMRLIVRHNNATRHESLDRQSEADLCAQIAAIRDSGHVVDRGFTWPSAIIVAMEIIPAPGLPPLAVALGGLNDQFAPRLSAIIANLAQALAPWHNHAARAGPAYTGSAKTSPPFNSPIAGK
jgi:DNA-binding IclR family transcriptional regulator